MARTVIANATVCQVAKAMLATATVQAMPLEALQAVRIERLTELLRSRFASNKAAMGRALGYRDGAFVRQMIEGERPVSEKTARAIEVELRLPEGWMDQVPTTTVVAGAASRVSQHAAPIDIENNPDYPAIRRVKFKLSAGASGFAVEYIDSEEDAPIVFRRQWFESRGYEPRKLLAVRVANGSMEPGLYHNDTVVLNTADTEPKDGAVFAVNYEGELCIKRLVRNTGQWWLHSDNPDQRRYPPKLCDERVFLLGRIVHKQSEQV